MDLGQSSSRYDASAPPRAWTRAYTIVALVAFGAFAVGLAAWCFKRRGEAEELEARLQRLNQENSSVLAMAAETQRARQKMEAFIEAAKQATQRESGLSVAPALQSIGASVEEGVQLVAADAVTEASGWRLQVQGIASGLAPRVLADRYRWKLQESLARRFQVSEACHFTRLEYAPETSADADERQAVFTVAAAIAPGPAATPKEPASP